MTGDNFLAWCQIVATVFVACMPSSGKNKEYQNIFLLLLPSRLAALENDYLTLLENLTDDPIA